MANVRPLVPLAALLLVGVSACSSDTAACTDLREDEVAVLLGQAGENWKGDGTFTVTAAQRSPVEGQNDFFTGVVYLQGDAAGATGEVYVFATAADDLSAPGAGLMGATPFTRERWTWGEVAQRGAPLEDAAREAVADAPVCLP